jgi:hypothetical protein
MAAAGWSSLPGDLANLVADRLLATNDLDFYMGFHAVCHGWRASTADPRSSPHGDPRFQPRQWVMVDEGRHNGDDDSRLFVNVSTGRFVRRDIRLAIRSHLLVAAAGGWLVLAARRSPQAVRLLNPFTDSFIQFAAPVPPELDLKVSAHVIGSSPCSQPLVPLYQDHRHRILG